MDKRTCTSCFNGIMKEDGNVPIVTVSYDENVELVYTMECSNPECHNKTKSWRSLYSMLPELVGMEDKHFESMNKCLKNLCDMRSE